MKKIILLIAAFSIFNSFGMESLAVRSSPEATQSPQNESLEPAHQVTTPANMQTEIATEDKESFLSGTQGCCFLSFEQHDHNYAVSQRLRNAIENKILSIIPPCILLQITRHYPTIQEESLNVSQVTFLATTPENLIVIVPESLHQLGIIISESEKQKPRPSVDLSAIHTKYGLQNLHLINPENIINCDKYKDSWILSTDNYYELIGLFRSLIDITSPHHPSRLYLTGHGDTDLIASMSISEFNFFLTALCALDAKFLYIASCYAGGTNILKLQNIIHELKVMHTKELLQKTAMPFPIVITATGGMPQNLSDDINELFIKLNQFLKDPSWAIEFGPGVKKPEMTITDVIQNKYSSWYSTSLPSIRLPGNSGFFRSLNVGQMKIITISKIVEKGYEKITELLAQSKNPDKAIADDAKMKLKQPLGIELTIKPDVKFIQIFPTDLTDFTFEIAGGSESWGAFKAPLFISKLTGRGHHFIGSIRYTCLKDDCEFPLNLCNFIKLGFLEIYSVARTESPKCWFIKDLHLVSQDKTQKFKNLVIKIDSTRLDISIENPSWLGKATSYAYINENGEYILVNNEGKELKIDKVTFESTIKSWFESTKPAQETLTEATGGVEITAEEKEKLIKGKSSNSRLINPQYQRTSEDLFNMFMADN